MPNIIGANEKSNPDTILSVLNTFIINTNNYETLHEGAMQLIVKDWLVNSTVLLEQIKNEQLSKATLNLILRSVRQLQLDATKRTGEEALIAKLIDLEQYVLENKEDKVVRKFEGDEFEAILQLLCDKEGFTLEVHS